MNTLTRRIGSGLLSLATAVTLGAGLVVAPATMTSAVATSTSSASCNRVVGTPGSIDSLPLSQRNWPLTGGLHMSTTGNVARNSGVIDGRTHLYNSYWGMGYTGETVVLLRNSCRELIGVTDAQTWGVDAKAWFWNANERHMRWHAEVSPMIAQRVAYAEVVHNRVTGADGAARQEEWRRAACLVWKTHVPFMPCPVMKSQIR